MEFDFLFSLYLNSWTNFFINE